MVAKIKLSFARLPEAGIPSPYSRYWPNRQALEQAVYPNIVSMLYGL